MTAPLTILFVAWSVGSAYAVQHEGHGMTTAAAPLAPNAACAQGGRNTLRIVEAGDARLETARQAGSAADLQTAIAQAQATIAAAQAQLFACRAAVPTATPTSAAPDPLPVMDHTRMNTASPAAPGAQPTSAGAKPADPMAGMDHSKMGMGKPAVTAGPPEPVATAKAAAKTAEPAVAMDHSKMAMGGAAPSAADRPARAGSGKLPVGMAERVADPACPDNLGQATAPKAVHERKVYYFCSTKDRDEFRRNPVVYLKKRPR